MTDVSEKYRVLVVEDQQRNLSEVALGRLRNNPMVAKVLTATNSFDANKKLREGVDVVLCDVYYPALPLDARTSTKIYMYPYHKTRESGTTSDYPIGLIDALQFLGMGYKVGVCSDHTHHQNEIAASLGAEFVTKDLVIFEARSCMAGFEVEGEIITPNDPIGEWSGQPIVKDWDIIFCALIEKLHYERGSEPYPLEVREMVAS